MAGVTAAALATGSAEAAGAAGAPHTATATGAIYACYSNTTKALSERTKAKGCKAGFTELSWNAKGPKDPRDRRERRGPQGSAGPQGAEGPQGPQGAKGPPGASADFMTQRHSDQDLDVKTVVAAPGARPGEGAVTEQQLTAARSGAGLLGKLFAHCQHEGYQVLQRPVQVVLTHLDCAAIHADVEDGSARYRLIQRHGCQGPSDEVFPQADVVALGGVHHAALHSAVLLNPGHHDPHRPILFLCG
jgi:hypothetical protein